MEEGERMQERVIDGMAEQVLERAMIAGVAHTLDETVYRVEGVPAARLFSELARQQVNVDTIVQTGPEIVFSAPSADRGPAARALDALGASWRVDDDLGKVSVVGAGMKSHPGVAATALSALDAAGIEPRVVSTSPIKISVHVGADEVDRAVLALHTAFGLAAEGS
jgi:aspartate kinase